MILRVADIPRDERHLIPVADPRQQIRHDRVHRSLQDPELQAMERSLGAAGEDSIDWHPASAS